MSKLKKIKNGEYIGGDKYTITPEASGKSKVVFNPDSVITEPTPVGAEVLNEMQLNGTYTLNTNRIVDGQKEVYVATLEGFTEFDNPDLNLILKINSNNSSNNVYLRLNNIDYQILNCGIGNLISGRFTSAKKEGNYIKLLSLEKTDLVENDTNKIFSTKGAFDLKTWLVTNYTTLMNNIKSVLDNDIATKLPHGGYGQTAQQLKNEVDTKVSKNGDTLNGILTSNAASMMGSNITGMHLHSNSDLIGFLNRTGGWIFRTDQVGTTHINGNIYSGGSFTISNPAPVIELNETDTGIKTLLIADGTGGRLQRDSSVGPEIFSWGRDSANFYGLASGNVSKSGDTMTGLLQMNAPIQSAGDMSDHGAIANLGGGSFRFGTAGLNWRIGVKGSDGHLGVWTQQDDTILFQPYNFSPEGRLTAQGGLILPQSNQASINVKGICGGYNQAVGFNCGLNVSNANGALDALVVPKYTSTFTPMSKIQTVTEGVGYTTRYVMGTLSTGGNYGRYQLLAFGDDPGNLLSSWTWDMNDGTFETNKLKVHGTSTFSTEIVSSAHTMLRSSVTGMHLHSNGNAIGFLSSSGGWIFRVDQVTGEVISGYNSVTMPTGLRMYSAGDSIGFLGTDTNWKLRIDNNGNTFSEGKVDAKGGKMGGYLNSLVGDYAGFKSTSSGVLENRYASGISWNDTPTNSGFDIKAELGLLRPNTNPGDWGKITLSSIVNRDTGTVKTWEFGMQDGSFNCPGVVTSQGSEVLTFANANRYCPHRVGDIIESTSAEHPASTWLGTQWERYGNGMVVVGVSEGEGEFASAGQTGGSKTHSLTIAEMPPHTHPSGGYDMPGDPNLGLPSGDTSGSNTAANTGATGGGHPHNNLQPYVALYRWRRIA